MISARQVITERGGAAHIDSCFYDEPQQKTTYNFGAPSLPVDHYRMHICKAIEKERFSFAAGVMLRFGAGYEDELDIYTHEDKHQYTVTNGKIKAVVWPKFRKYKRVYK